MSIDLILGTAGHIDHGKTTLIRCLTGTDTDRLPEEKRRGITIELGFAELELGEYRLGIVDVPGHEKFVRQMLAGATGMDVALLVIAADDSVKPQTREHLDVLRLLDLKAGVIALTKCDAADPDWIGLVEDEVRELVADTFLSDAPIVRTSAVSGEGMEPLRDALHAAAKAVAGATQQRSTLPFRMGIDRVFTLAGHGTVVTGSVVTGSASTGDTLVVEPGGTVVRTRGMHNHDREVNTLSAGQRAAINLAGIHHGQLRRGHELASVGHLLASRLMSVRLRMLPGAPRPLKRRDRVRVHIGTAEVLASFVPLDCDSVAPGADAYAQFFLRDEIVSTWNQPFVVRSESPVLTIAGGTVLVPSASKIRQATAEDLDQLKLLSSHKPSERAGAAIYFGAMNGSASPARDSATASLFAASGIDRPADVHRQLVEEGQVALITESGQRQTTVHYRRLAQYAERVAKVLDTLHDQNPLQTMFDRSALATKFQYFGGPPILDFVLKTMAKDSRIRLTERAVGLTDRAPKLSKNERLLLGQISDRYRQALFQPPTVKECEQQAQKNQNSVRSLIALAASDGDLIEIGDQLYLHAEVESDLRRILRNAFGQQGELTVSEIRERLGTTRKYAIPICAYLDRIGFTKRVGDVRRLAESAG